MSKVYAFGDTHFGHKNMALKRGFKTIEEHDSYIISQWNSVVTKRDKVFLLGDITMEKSNYAILKKLKGNKVVILGNHDKGGHVPELLKYVSSVCGSVSYKGCILTHIPIHPQEFYRWRLNIHAHTHEVVIQDERYKCVSAESIGYIPVELSTLIPKKDE